MRGCDNRNGNFAANNEAAQLALYLAPNDGAGRFAALNLTNDIVAREFVLDYYFLRRERSCVAHLDRVFVI